jgi:hypothetical protein
MALAAPLQPTLNCSSPKLATISIRPPMAGATSCWVRRGDRTLLLIRRQLRLATRALLTLSKHAAWVI